jgi:hypothetical protein
MTAPDNDQGLDFPVALKQKTEDKSEDKQSHFSGDVGIRITPRKNS